MKSLLGFRKRKVTREEARERYPFTGNCPVVLRTGDGVSVGRCYHSLYGNICPTHGNLTGLLIEGEGAGTDRFERIEENRLPPREKREFVPDLYRSAL